MVLRIGEVAKQAGIAASAIRFYEREALIPVADRSGNTRVYGPDILDRLALIELAKSAGFTVAEIRQLVQGELHKESPGPRWRALAKKKQAEIEARIAEAERIREMLDLLMGCECSTFQDCTGTGC